VKKLANFLLTALFIAAPAAYTQVKYVAVVETEVDAQSGAAIGLTPAEVRLMTAELRREAVRNLPSDKYNIMTSETVYAQGGAVLEECAEENCVIALGSKIGADYIVRGTISKLQTRITLSVEMYETENGNLVASSDPVRSENIGELIEKAAAACADMYQTFVKTRRPAQKSSSARYIVNVNVNPADGGYVSRSQDKAVYDAGEQLVLKANANNGYVFTGWSGSSTSTNATLTGSINDDLTFIANFQRTYTLSADVSPSGGGAVSRSPDKEVYKANEQVTVTAIPAKGYAFAGWMDAAGVANPATVTMDGNKMLTAKFKVVYTLATNVSASGGGSVIRNPDKEAYTVGEKVIVTAVPNEGYVFIGWVGAVTSRRNLVTVTMNRDKTLTPNFYRKSVPQPIAPKSERADSVKLTTSAPKLDLQEKLRITYGVGGGISYAGDFGGGVQWDNGGIIAMPSHLVGAYLSFDAAYAAISIGYSQGGGMWNTPNAVDPNNLPYMYRALWNIGLYAKYPNMVSLPIAGTKNSINIYPMLGIDFEYTVSGELDFENKPVYVLDGNNPYGYEAGALNAIWVKIGGGFDFYLTQKVFASFELLYGVRKSNWLETDQAEKNGAGRPRLGHGLTLNAGAGFKL